MRTHVVIGTGNGIKTTAPAITESLGDVVDEGDVIVLPWYGGKPADALAAVYDYVLDKETDFILLHDKGVKVPAAFSGAGHGVVVAVTSFGKKMAAEYEDDPGTAMVLGEDERTDSDILEFVDAVKGGVPLLSDLSDGLVPIELDEGDEEEKPQDSTTGDDGDAEEYAKFSMEELAEMPVRVLKRVAAHLLDTVPSKKEDILKAISETREDKSSTDVDDVDLAFDALLTLLDGEGRIEALARTNIQQAWLWYHYGSEAPAKG